MTVKSYLSLLTSALLASLLMACGSDSPSTPDTPDTPDVPDVPDVPAGSVEKLVTIDAGQTYQTIAGFGASDCWMPATGPESCRWGRTARFHSSR